MAISLLAYIAFPDVIITSTKQPLPGTSNYCLDQESGTVNLTCEVADDGASYSWTLPDGSMTNEQTITASAIGSYTCMVNTSCGPDTKVANVSGEPLPITKLSLLIFILNY